LNKFELKSRNCSLVRPLSLLSEDDANRLRDRSRLLSTARKAQLWCSAHIAPASRVNFFSQQSEAYVRLVSRDISAGKAPFSVDDFMENTLIDNRGTHQ
jgi:hypothetical protein